jgi:PIN domain nuclease of toxin-antitoxin system
MLNLDTHVLLHALGGKLRPREQELLEEETWSISAIVLWEIAKLAQLGRIEIDLDDPALVRVLAQIQIWPLSVDVCRAILSLDFSGDPARNSCRQIYRQIWESKPPVCERSWPTWPLMISCYR